MKAGPFANPSIFYLLLSAEEFGAADSGDYYRYFRAAATAWYAATNQARKPAPPPSDAAQRTAECLVEISRQMTDPELKLTPAYRGWLWANAMTFLKCVNHGRDQAGVCAAALTCLHGGFSDCRKRSNPSAALGAGMCLAPEPNSPRLSIFPLPERRPYALESGNHCGDSRNVTAAHPARFRRLVIRRCLHD